MNPRHALSLLFLAAASLSAQTEKPNILLIAVDDLNDWASTLAGHPQAATPNIDRLADVGMVFSNAHCQAPLCGPSRASIFTGLYPSTSGIYLHINDDNIKMASAPAYQSTFLTHYFVEQGYKTMGAGKLLHQGAGASLLQEYAGHKDFGPYSPEHFKYEAAGTSTDWGPYPERDDQMPDYAVANYGIERLSETHDKPFFLGLGFNRPHVPWYVPQKWFDLFPLDSVTTPPYLADDQADIPEISRIIHEMPPTPETTWLIEQGYWKEVVQAYLACVAFVDNQIGRVLDALENSEYADNTIVVLWSDHGYHLGEKNVVAKMTLWEESSRVPLIFAGPGIPGGVFCERPVGLIDLYPTLLELAGLPENPQNDGRSIVPLLENPETEWNHAALTFWGENNTAVRTEDYRYILFEDGSEELYDRTVDPNEWNNLANNSTYDSLKSELQQNIPQPQKAMSSLSSFTWNDYWRTKSNEASGNVFDPDDLPDSFPPITDDWQPVEKFEGDEEVFFSPVMGDRAELEILTLSAGWDVLPKVGFLPGGHSQTTFFAKELPKPIPEGNEATLYFQANFKSTNPRLFLGLSDVPVIADPANPGGMTSPSNSDAFEVQFAFYQNATLRLYTRHGDEGFTGIMPLQVEQPLDSWFEVWGLVDNDQDVVTWYIKDENDSVPRHAKIGYGQDNLDNKALFRNGTSEALQSFLIEIPAGGSTDEFWLDNVYINYGGFTLEAPETNTVDPGTDPQTVDTNDFMGWLEFYSNGYTWSYSLSSWLYLPQDYIGDMGSWCYFLK